MSKRWPTKTVVGLTGNIATGKSVVMRLAAERGAFVVDADKVVHEILSKDSQVQTAIIEAFGNEVQYADGSINRVALGSLVFREEVALAKLESIVHPHVRPLIVALVEKTPASVVFIEAIKLLEGDLAAECDQIWVTNCGKFRQMQRLVIARGMDENQAFTRIAAQAPQEEKLARADVVIDTSGSLAQTQEQVSAAWSNWGETVAEAEPEAVPVAVAVVVEEKPVAPPPPPPVVTPAPSEPATAEVVDKVVVRRARPSDIPSIMLLIHKATEGRVKPKRAEILMSLSDRGYLIGQNESGISTVMGWYTDKGFAVIEQIYVHPREETAVTGQAVLNEVIKTANELMAEAIFAFFAEDDISMQLAMDLLLQNEFELVTSSENFPRVWRQAYEETKPEGYLSYIKRLWNARVA